MIILLQHSRYKIFVKIQLSLKFSGKKKCETKENLADKALKAQKRKDIETEKKEKIKKKTVDTLLKKKDSKVIFCFVHTIKLDFRFILGML